MHLRPNRLLPALAALLAATTLPAALPQAAPDFTRFAPGASTPTRLIGRINDQQRTSLPADVPFSVRNRQPLGFVDASLPMDSMILALKPSADAQARLDALSAAQQDPKSPLFHKWLTPEQFGAMFGPSKQDMDAVVGWLVAQGFSVDEVSAGRLSITFSGTAAQVQQAFHTTIRDYQINGEVRHANAEAPSIPAALAGVVSGVVSLHNIPRKAMNTGFKPLPGGIRPNYTSSGGGHYLAAGDFATIYNLAPLYAAGIDGTGVTIAIVGRTNIKVSDVTYFRSFMGLPANDPTVIINGADPGSSDSGEVGEAMLDVEWSGAVAKKATVKFIATKSTNTADGVDLSASYIVNHQATLGATVMSTSFGSCESGMGSSENTFYNNLWQQAATEGITSFVSSGDAGAAGCNGGSDTTGTGAAVSGLASTPYNVCVGGTEFLDGGGSATYWNASNGTDNSSAKSYIPEEVWNESAGMTDPSGGAGQGLWSGGGGVSTIYSKPTWQVAPGVPADSKRDCPDVSLAAAGYTGYIVVQGHTSTTSGLGAVGGTSAASPSFAGLMALVVQKQGGTGQGNANPRLYQLGNAQYASSGTAVFHDVTTGSNTVPGVTGFNATTGYDLGSGLGSVDGNALVNSWTTSVSISPASSLVSKGARLALSATSSLTPNTVIWSADGGAFTSATTPGDGATTTTYIAPATITGASQAFHVTATGSDGSTKGQATITVYDPAQVTLAITPGTDQALLTQKATTLTLTASATVGAVDWTASAGTITGTTQGNNTDPATLDLSTVTAPADVTVTATSEANHSKVKSIVVHLRSMDVNNDGAVDARDLLTLMGAYGSANPAADLDGSGTVGDGDLTAFLTNF